MQQNYQHLDGPEDGEYICTLSVPIHSSATYEGIGTTKKDAQKAACSKLISWSTLEKDALAAKDERRARKKSRKC